MYAIALSDMEGSVDEVAPRLAPILRTTAYELRIHLSKGVPAILAMVSDVETAKELAGALRATGQPILVFDASRVVHSENMVPMDHFRFGTSELITAPPRSDRLAYRDILVMLRAIHEVHVETEHETTKRAFSIGRAVMSGGLVLTKKKTTTRVAHAQQREQVVYIYHTGDGPPWLLRETSTKYNEALGPELQPTKQANFLKTIEMLRAKAPHAPYDDRLMHRKVTSQPLAASFGKNASVTDSTVDSMDLQAHLLALVLVKKRKTAR